MGHQSHSVTSTILNRITWLSTQDPKKEFECLMHLFNEESLKECFHKLDGKKAVGIDGIDKASYAQNLDENIKNLIQQMKNIDNLKQNLEENKAKRRAERL